MNGPPGSETPLYERLLAGVGPGAAVLEVRSGPTTFGAFATERGMTVTGADARERPWPEAPFDLIGLVGVLEELTNPVPALREGCRLAGPGGRVRATVRGRPDERETRAIAEALTVFLPRENRPGPAVPTRTRSVGARYGRASSLLASRPGGPLPVTEPTRLREVAGRAGLRVVDVHEVVCTYHYADGEQLVAAVLESGSGRRAVMRSSGPRAVRRAVLSGLSGFRDGDGYRLHDTFRVLDATPADPHP